MADRYRTWQVRFWTTEDAQRQVERVAGALGIPSRDVIEFVFLAGLRFMSLALSVQESADVARNLDARIPEVFQSLQEG